MAPVTRSSTLPVSKDPSAIRAVFGGNDVQLGGVPNSAVHVPRQYWPSMAKIIGEILVPSAQRSLEILILEGVGEN